MQGKTLNIYKKNIYSQFGEDGIIKEILNRINISSGTCIEFGAWDGLVYANTANLWTTTNWKGVLIEPDKSKFGVLKKVLQGHNSIALDTFIKPTGEQSLENILDKNGISFNEVKLLSVDVDGNEYHILKNLKKLMPPLVIAEYNPTIPPEIEVISKEDAFFGSSARSIYNLMKEKGYELVAMTKTNCFFVLNEYKDKFSDIDTSLENLFERSSLTYLITGYRGAYAFSQYPAFGIGLPLNRKLIEKGNLYFLKFSSIKVRWIHFKCFIKEMGKKIIGAENILKVKSSISYTIWKIKGMPIPGHGKYKWLKIKESSKRNKIKTLVETGTAGGGTAMEMSKYFNKIFTIELEPTLYHQGRAFLQEKKNVTCIEGDSSLVLKKLLEKINEPALFWLDAHYSGEGTAKAEIETPVIKELLTIFERKNKKDVILIDDARCFDGTHDYPTIEQIKTLVGKQNTFSFKVERDIIFIEPK